jgi:cbb3-type cytochrome oxidase subunit 3
MYKEILRGVDNIGIFPTISFTIFFLFFLGLLIYVLTANKAHVAHMSAMPLEDEATLTKTISKHQQ